MTGKNYLTIGQLAKLAGVGVETIRYYQRRGLMPQPEKPYGGIRRYSADMVARLRFIQRAKQLGFSLSEVSELLSLDDGACDDVAELAVRKKAQIERKIHDLRQIAAQLQGLLDQCEHGERTRCPLIDSLSEPLPPNKKATTGS